MKVPIRILLSQKDPVQNSPLFQRLILTLCVAYAVRKVRCCGLLSIQPKILYAFLTLACIFPQTNIFN